jgi:hypothetical protein
MNIKRLVTWGLLGMVPVTWVQHCVASDQVLAVMKEGSNQEKNKLQKEHLRRMAEEQEAFEQNYRTIQEESIKQFNALEEEYRREVHRLIEIFNHLESLLVPYGDRDNIHGLMDQVYVQRQNELNEKFKQKEFEFEQEKGQRYNALTKEFTQRLSALEKEFKEWNFIIENTYISTWNAFRQTQ